MYLHFPVHMQDLDPTIKHDRIAMAEYDFVMRQLEPPFTLSGTSDEEIQELASGLWLGMKPRMVRQGDSKSACRTNTRHFAKDNAQRERESKKKGYQNAAEKYGIGDDVVTCFI